MEELNISRKVAKESVISFKMAGCNNQVENVEDELLCNINGFC